MLHKTRGIIFHTTGYGESSLVVKIYTELFGLQSYIVNSVRKKNAKVKASVFSPLCLVEMEVYHKERSGLQRMADVRAFPALNFIPADMQKSSMVFFMNELLYKCIREEEPNPRMFDFLFGSVQWLDAQDPLNPDYHLLFMLEFSKHLGFFPSGNYSETQPVFNLLDGVFQEGIPHHPYYLEGEVCRSFSKLLASPPGYGRKVTTGIAEKRVLLENLLLYFQLHIAGIGEIKSHKILEQIWS